MVLSIFSNSSEVTYEEVVTIKALYFAVNVLRRNIEVLTIAFAAQKEKIGELPKESYELICFKFLVF